MHRLEAAVGLKGFAHPERYFEGRWTNVVASVKTTECW